MIRKAVYSYWDDSRYKLNGGFKTQKDLAITLTLSVELAKKQFDEVELVTNSLGKKLLIDHYKIPFTSVKVVLDQFDNVLHPDLWAYIKIYAYCLQDCPFIHIDNDVLLLTPIPEDKLKADFLFQNKEKMSEHRGYTRLIKEAKEFQKIDLDIFSSSPDYAFNCGVVGVNKLDFLNQWKTIVDQYLFSPENESYWDNVNDRHSHNHLFEQYFISSLLSKSQLHVETLLGDDFMNDAINVFPYCHLWGPTKREPEIMQKVKNRLYRDYPKYKELFEQPQTHMEIFTDIYKQELWGKGKGSGAGSSAYITAEYREFLRKFIKDHKIKSICDFGCGDFQFMKLIDLQDIAYVGLDCVPSIIDNNNRLYSNSTTNFRLQKEEKKINANEFDLLIIKDVFIHWKNQEIIDFLNELKNYDFKYILITNQVDKDYNEDIHTTGEYHSVDLNKEPFNIGCQEILKWTNDKKITYLITN